VQGCHTAASAAAGGGSAFQQAAVACGVTGFNAPQYKAVNSVTVGRGAMLTIPKGDGLSDGYNTVQGVRTFDTQAGVWSTPDAYRGNTQDPMSQKPYMWNRNNPYLYSDPSGFKIQWSGDLYDQAMAEQAYDQAIDYFSSHQAYEAANFLRTLRDDKSFTISGTMTSTGATENDSAWIGARGAVFLRWDSRGGLAPTSGKRAMSPALALLHEAAHAFRAVKDPDGLRRDAATPDLQYDNKEERRVIQGWESGTGLAIGEILRFDHGGTPCYVTQEVIGRVCR
jgi:hypothetical protein